MKFMYLYFASFTDYSLIVCAYVLISLLTVVFIRGIAKHLSVIGICYTPIAEAWVPFPLFLPLRHLMDFSVYR